MAEQKIPYKIYLSEEEMPKAWYNVRADMKTKPAPLVNPATGEPCTADDLRPVFCDELIRQELDDDTAYIPIPQEIRDFYKMYRPSPLVRAYCLEKALDTPAKIYYKFEGNNTSGSHKRIDPLDFLNIDIQLPFIEEQTRIGSLLAYIDSKIALNRAINHNLPILGRSLKAVIVHRAA